jgi:hypothetical protein
VLDSKLLDSDLNPRLLRRCISTFVRGCRDTIGGPGTTLIFYARDQVRDVIGSEIEVDNVVYEIRNHASDDELACMCDAVRDGKKVNSEYCSIRTQRTALDAFADAVEGP